MRDRSPPRLRTPRGVLGGRRAIERIPSRAHVTRRPWHRLILTPGGDRSMTARVILLLTLTAASASAMPVIQTHACDNGLQVLVVEDHSAPLLTVEIAAKNGA